MGKTRIKFWEYIAETPNLYDGCDLDAGTIDYLNLYFWDYKINPITFPREFFVTLKRAVPTYKNLKGIEIREGIDSLTTSRVVRDAAYKTINNLTKSANGTDTTTHRGTDVTEISGDPSIDYNSYEQKDFEVKESYDKTESDSDSLAASKDLPMRNNGTFDSMTSFNNGASVAGKNKTTGKSETWKNYSDENRTEHGGTDTQHLDQRNETTWGHTISKTDGQTIRDTGSVDVTDQATEERVDGLTADLVRKIWNYLVAPKAIDYLVDELSKCFILVC